jgi:hypothetical protein
MTNVLTAARLSRRHVLLLFTASVVAAAVAIGLAIWPSGAAAGTVPGGARVIPGPAKVVTVTPVFGLDPNTSRHHLDHAFTITDPAKVARIAAIIDGLPRFPIGILSCTRGNGAAMKLTFRTRKGGPVVATVLATYTGCRYVSIPGSNTPLLDDYTKSGKQVQKLVLSIAGVRWPYTPDVLPPLPLGN